MLRKPGRRFIQNPPRTIQNDSQHDEPLGNLLLLLFNLAHHVVVRDPAAVAALPHDVLAIMVVDQDGPTELPRHHVPLAIRALNLEVDPLDLVGHVRYLRVSLRLLLMLGLLEELLGGLDRSSVGIVNVEVRVLLKESLDGRASN